MLKLHRKARHQNRGGDQIQGGTLPCLSQRGEGFLPEFDSLLSWPLKTNLRIRLLSKSCLGAQTAEGVRARCDTLMGNCHLSILNEPPFKKAWRTIFRMSFLWGPDYFWLA